MAAPRGRDDVHVGPGEHHCTDLVLDSHDDWRLPTRIELVSIVDYTRVTPAIDQSVFPSTPASEYWSASAYVTAGRAWTVSFNGGDTTDYDATMPFPVRCVR